MERRRGRSPGSAWTTCRSGCPALPTWGDPAVAEARAISAVCGGVRVWSLYVPNGRAVGDPHYYYKLEWLAALRDYGAKQLAADPHAQIAFCGDFNIAPTDDDIWSVEYYRELDPRHRRRSGRRSHDLVDAGFTDVVRPYHPGPGVYTYWDYTQLSFQKRRGMRIDFALASPGAGRPGDRGVDRPRGTQGQAAVRPRAGHRRAGELTWLTPMSGSWSSNTIRPIRCCAWATG